MTLSEFVINCRDQWERCDACRDSHPRFLMHSCSDCKYKDCEYMAMERWSCGMCCLDERMGDNA